MFWESLGLAGQIYFVVACIASALLVIQIILTIIGIGADIDFDMIGDSDLDGFGMFTVRGLVAFFALGGWMGVLSVILGLPWVWSILVFLACGSVGLLGVAFALKGISKLQTNGNIIPKEAIGKKAEVYLTIPKSGEGAGKINLLIRENYIEADAINSGDQPIMTGDFVRVVDVLGDKYVVEKFIEIKE